MGCEPSLSSSPFLLLLSQCALLYVHRPFLFSPIDVAERSKGERERGVNEGSEETSLLLLPFCSLLRIASPLPSPPPTALAHPTPSSLLSHPVSSTARRPRRDSFPHARPLSALSECPPWLTPRTWRLCWLPYPDCARGAGALLLDRGATACAATCVGPAAPSCRTTSRGCHALRCAGSPLRFSRSRTCGSRRRRRCARQRRGCLSQSPGS